MLRWLDIDDWIAPIQTAVDIVTCRIFLAGKVTFTIELLFSNTSNSTDESSSEVSLLDSSAHSLTD
jgi:hypothetical protein